MSTILRISLVLAREDNQRLYDELVQFPKGQRRVNRLRTLAYDGLLTQGAASMQAKPPLPAPARPVKAPSSPPDRVQASLELFSEPITT